MQYTVIVDINGQFVNKLRQPLPLCSAFKSEKGSSTASVELFNIVSSVSLCKVSGSQKQAITAAMARSDIQRQGRKYGNLPNMELTENMPGYLSAGCSSQAKLAYKASNHF